MSAARAAPGAADSGQKIHILYLASPGCAVWLGESQSAGPVSQPMPDGQAPASLRDRSASIEGISAAWLAYLSIRLGLPPGLPRGSIHRRRLAGFMIFSVGATQPSTQRELRMLREPRTLRARRKARRAVLEASTPPERIWRADQEGPAMVALRLPARLTPDQRAVYDLLVRGLTNPQIAARLHRKRRWVSYRVAEIKRLVGIQARSELLKRKAVFLYNR